MKITTAYEALDGSLHKDKEGAAFASIAHIAETENKDSRGVSMGNNSIAFMIEHRNQIGNILRDIDAPDAIPDLPYPGR